MICPSRCGFSVGVYAKPLIGNARAGQYARAWRDVARP